MHFIQRNQASTDESQRYIWCSLCKKKSVGVPDRQSEPKTHSIQLNETSQRHSEIVKTYWKSHKAFMKKATDFHSQTSHIDCSHHQWDRRMKRYKQEVWPSQTIYMCTAEALEKKHRKMQIRLILNTPEY